MHGSCKGTLVIVQCTQEITLDEWCTLGGTFSVVSIGPKCCTLDRLPLLLRLQRLQRLQCLQRLQRLQCLLEEQTMGHNRAAHKQML